MKKINILFTALLTASAINCANKVVIAAAILGSLQPGSDEHQPNLYKAELHLPPANTYTGPNAAPNYPGVRVATKKKFPTSKQGKNSEVGHK